MGRLRGIPSGIALSGVSLLICLIGLEVAVRAGLFRVAETRSTRIATRLAADPRLPNFRTPGFEFEEKGENFRIVVVGDSFAWGVGVHFEDTFPHRLGVRLNAVSRGDRFEVINWSRPGWNTLRQYESLEHRLAELDPDLVIHSFVLNDAEPSDRGLVDQMLAAAVRQEPRPGLSTWLFGHSRLYALVWTRLENHRTHRELTAYYHSLFEENRWRVCRRALKRMRNLVRQQGVPMIVVIFPVFDHDMDDTYPYWDLHSQVREACTALEIPALDLMEVFAGVEGRRLAVVPFTNAHPNELAHRIAADGILDYLVRGKLIPRTDHKPQRRRRARQEPPS